MVDHVDRGRSHAAEAWARPRAEKGDADAQFLMGYLVFGEKRIDFRLACEWLHRAAAQDHPEALFELSRVDESQDRANSGPPRSDAQRALLRKAADLGSVRAQADLALHLKTGYGGFAKDAVEGRAWCVRAAEGGDVGAQSMLGSMMLRGEGGPVLTAEGLGWLERAAANDRSPRLMDAFHASGALQTLARVFQRGIPGIPADPEKADAFKKRVDEYRQRREEELGDEEWSVSTTPGAPRTKRSFRYANPEEAKAVLRQFMEPYRKRSHAELVALVNKDRVERAHGPTGSEYEIKLYAHWSDQPGGDVSVCGAINDYGWCAAQDIYELFDMSPEGTIVGDST
jgi:hypothetical protein